MSNLQRLPIIRVKATTFNFLREKMTYYILCTSMSLNHTKISDLFRREKGLKSKDKKGGKGRNKREKGPRKVAAGLDKKNGLKSY